MIVERLPYVIWAADTHRAMSLYCRVFDGAVLERNEVLSAVEICGRVIGIRGGGEGQHTRTV